MISLQNLPTKRELALEQLLTGVLIEGEMRRPGYIDAASQVAAAAGRFSVAVDGEFQDLVRETHGALPSPWRGKGGVGGGAAGAGSG